MALCRWDPGLTPHQRALYEANWNRRGLYDVGMRKLPQSQLDQEHNWRVTTKKRILDALEELLEQFDDETETEEQRPQKRICLDGEIKKIRRQEKEPEFRSTNKRRTLYSAI